MGFRVWGSGFGFDFLAFGSLQEFAGRVRGCGGSGCYTGIQRVTQASRRREDRKMQNQMAKNMGHELEIGVK